MIILFC